MWNLTLVAKQVKTLLLIRHFRRYKRTQRKGCLEEVNLPLSMAALVIFAALQNVGGCKCKIMLRQQQLRLHKAA